MNTFDKLTEAINELNAMFGDVPILYNPIMAEEEWYYTEGRDIRWNEAGTPIDEEGDYSETVKQKPIILEDWSAFYVHSCTGENYYMVFKNSNRREDLE